MAEMWYLPYAGLPVVVVVIGNDDDNNDGRGGLYPELQPNPTNDDDDPEPGIIGSSRQTNQ